MKLPFSYKNYDDTGTPYQVSPFIYNENAREVYLELLSNELKKPNLPDDLMSNLKRF